MKTATLIAVALLFACAVPVFAQGPFTDVPADHWAYEAVNSLQRDGILIGYPDGTFAGKRTITRYEFAVAIARMMDVVRGITPPVSGGGLKTEDVEKMLQGYAKNSQLPTIPGNLATKDDIARLQKLIDQFQEELADLGVQVDAMKRDLAALEARVSAVEVEQRRVKLTGEANVFAVANSQRSGIFNAFDRDDRQVATDATVGRTIGVISDFDLNVVGRVSDTTTANATINYGNYLNYIACVDDYVGGVRPTTSAGNSTVRDSLSDNFFPYYLYIGTTLGKGELTVGRFPLQFTPYTLKKIDVDSYTSILKTDDGNYPVDGIKTAFGFGGVNLTLYAAKHDSNDYLQNGLTGQPTAGLFDNLASGVIPGTAFAPFHAAGGHAVGGLPGQVTQSAGARALVGIPWSGNLGLTFYQAWSQSLFNAVAPYDQARVFGADITIPFLRTWNFAGSWTESDTLGSDRFPAAADITDDNAAMDAKISTNIGRIGLGAGYKDIGFNFAAAGAWDKIGRWTNPTNVKGPYADFTIPVMSNVNVVLNGEFLTVKKTVAANTQIRHDDNILKAEGGLKWGLSDANAVALGVEWIRFQSDTAGIDDATEVYYNVGWAHKVSPNAGFKVGYQFINYQPTNVSTFAYGAEVYRAGQGVVQFGVSF